MGMLKMSKENRMPVVFSGHGDPMIALRDDEITRGMRRVGDDILAKYGKPKAILSISAHWYKKGTFIQTTAEPKQIYDIEFGTIIHLGLLLSHCVHILFGVHRWDFCL